MKKLVMLRNTLIGVAIFAETTVAAVGQEEPTNWTQKPTLADVQDLAEIISGDKSKLSAYCELGKLHDETRQAVQCNDTNAIAAVAAKTDDFERQLGLEYDTVHAADMTLTKNDRQGACQNPQHSLGETAEEIPLRRSCAEAVISTVVSMSP